MERVKTSYSEQDVEILLQNIEGRVPELDTRDREKLNQQGVHYSEMLPKEEEPTAEYMRVYEEAIKGLSEDTARYIMILGEKIASKKRGKVVLVSLARAGTPVGVLVKRYLEKKYDIPVPHYSVSIIRGKGFDRVAMDYIIERHSASEIQFIDGWIGKGAINRELAEECRKLVYSDTRYKGIDSELAAVSDPANITSLYGTRADILLPSACLNSTVSGLVSRTVHIEGIDTTKEFHGARYYKEFEGIDKSIEFIETVVKYFEDEELYRAVLKEWNDTVRIKEVESTYTGLEEVKDVAKAFGVNDINKVKPGVGETTRVLLRRIPDKVLVRKGVDRKHIEQIYRLCEEKGVEIEEYPLKNYSVCGIIKDLADL